jgi:hypothetical protein
MVRRLLVLALFSVLIAAPVLAANTDSHTVTVDVQAINEVAITGGNITLTVNSATAGSEPNAATDATTSLDWTTNEDTRKITVASDVAVADATLTVVATGVTGGTAAAVVTLGTIAADFVTGISSTTGSGTLSYAASATAAQGTSNATYTITYTLTAG